jgi:cobalt-zinc-cadmium efflux system membrane fusion protein
MIEIKTGNSENGFTEVIGDENLGDRIFVIKGAYNLLMKMKNTGEE